MKPQMLKRCSECEHAIPYQCSIDDYKCDICHELVIEDTREVRDFCIVQARNALKAISEILDIE